MTTSATTPARPRAFNPIWLVWLAVIALALLTGLSLLRYGALDLGPRWGLRGATLVPGLVYTTMGCLILAAHPRHRVGLLVLGVGLGSTTQAVFEEYAIYGLVVAPGALPGALLAAWVENWGWVPVIGALGSLLPLYFPDGRLPSPRWRWAVTTTCVGLGLMMLGYGLAPGHLAANLSAFQNPVSLTLWGANSGTVAAGMVTAGSALLYGGIGLAVVAVLRRLRQAQGVERQQLKWFVYAVALTAALAPASFSTNTAWQIIYLVGATALPVSIGLAVLRYRLYDIDLIVNRTLVYALLTAILAGVYFGSVVLLQSLLAVVTGERQSALVTVLSTLTIAALFTPARRRVQAFIDQRFYRRKYDAARTLAGFSATARDDVDLSTLNERLLAAVTDTMQPAHVGLWVRGHAARPDESAA